MNAELKVADLATVEFSIDKICTLFFYGDKVFRGINSEYVAQVQDMFDGGMMKELIEKELFVNTWISTTKIEGFDLVIEHENIPYWNYPYEWSFTMLHRAANVVLDTNTVANKYNYEIFDVHAFNVVFDMTRPKYVDFGSILRRDSKNENSWSGYLNFYKSFYMPLYLYSKGYKDLSNCILLYNGFFSEEDLFRLRHRYANLFGNGFGNLLFKAHNYSRRITVARHERIMAKYGKHKHIGKILKFKALFQNQFNTKNAQKLIKSVGKGKIDSKLSDYQNVKTLASDPRFSRIAELVKTKLSDANSLIELGSNQGEFVNLALESTQISKVVATDCDKHAVDHIFIENENRKDVLPLVYDFLRPNNRSNTLKLEGRLPVDVVVALAVTHHLLLTEDVSLAHIFKVLKSLTSKYLIVEFMPLGLYSGDMDNIPPVPDYYTLEWFGNAFSEEFEHIADEEVGINRHIFIGKLK